MEESQFLKYCDGVLKFIIATLFMFLSTAFGSQFTENLRGARAVCTTVIALSINGADDQAWSDEIKSAMDIKLRTLGLRKNIMPVCEKNDLKLIMYVSIRYVEKSGFYSTAFRPSLAYGDLQNLKYAEIWNLGIFHGIDSSLDSIKKDIIDTGNEVLDILKNEWDMVHN